VQALRAPSVHAQVVLFAVPGAFTPTCSLKHLPGFIEKAHVLKVSLRLPHCLQIMLCKHVHHDTRCNRASLSASWWCLQ